MPDAKPQNRNAGAPPLESAVDRGPQVARADRDPDAHYEADPDQVVKVVHQEQAATTPVQGPTDFEARAADEDASTRDVRVTPSEASVWEASPPEDR